MLPRTVLAVKGRRGFQLRWIGPYARRAILVAPGVDPQQAWARVSASRDRLSEDEVLQAWSGLSIDDVLPTHVNGLVGVLAEQEQREHPRLASAADLWRAWRLWHRGERRWREPAYEPVASREMAIHDTVARSGRTLWMWLGSLEASIKRCLWLPNCAPLQGVQPVRVLRFGCSRPCRACHPE